MTKQKDFLTIPEAAKICAVNRSTLWRWIKSGKLQASVTVGKHHRILKEDLEAFLIDNGMFPLAKKQFPRNKILIVDDNPLILKAFKKTFFLANYEVETAQEGFEAGAKVMQFKPDLIILDLIMPGMDGFEVCKYLKKDPATSHIIIVALTGYDTEENRKRIIAAGADAYFTKPVDKDTLVQQVDSLLGKQYQFKESH